MNVMLRKELRLSTLLLTWLFIGFAFMTLIPGYPILCGVFFITQGIYQSFQRAREDDDTLFSALLPVARRDVVRGKYQSVILIELCGFALMAILTVLRMTILRDVAVYRQNVLMNANPFYLGTALLLFGLFNVIFVGGFWKTAYGIGKPFLIYIAVVFPAIGAAEALHHFPGLEALNAFGFDHIALQLCLLLVGAMLYVGMTYLSFQKACADFERIDL
ncbi:MAG: ABC-2 transporter permease [Clostridia bacterium]|nr:ABC-2 transporter permease [Clostridia bacterium]